MKKAISLVAVVLISHCAFAQTNNFPPSGNVGIGTYTPAVKTHILSHNEQLRLAYDSTHYVSFTTNSAGALSIFPNGNKIAIGSSTFSNVALYNAFPITGNATSYANYTVNQIQSDVTTQAAGYSTSLSTQAAAFTLPTLIHYNASQGALGAGSSITSQVAYYVQSNLTGATNNFGFYGNIPAGTGRWNLYMAGNAANYIGGNLGVATTTPIAKLQVGSASASAWGSISPMLFVSGTAIDNSTATGATVSGITTTQFTLGPHVLTAANGTSGSPVTYTTAATMYIAGAPSPGTNTIITSPYALYINSGDSFFNGTKNSFSGKILIGTTTARDEMLSVNGNIRARQIKIETANWPDYVFAIHYPIYPT